MTEFRGQTDQVEKIELPSAIQQVVWTKRIAALGAVVGVDVFTEFVGNGSSIEIELSDNSGKTFGKFKDKISGNHFWAKVKVPDEAKDALFAKVKLSKHGLDAKSNPLLLLTPIEISNLKWDKKEARRGDALKMTADIKGVTDGTETEIQIWEHDSDQAHDLITQFPILVKDSKVEAEWEFEYYEDTDDVPTEEESEKGYNPPEYFFRVKVGGVYADSEKLEFKDWIEFELIGMTGNPLKNVKYELKMADGSTKSGQTDDNGKIMVKDVSPGRYTIEFPEIAPD